MTLEKAIQETEPAKALHRATDKTLKKFNKAKQPYWDTCHKATNQAWRQYEKDIAPLEEICNREIARASQAYTKRTQNK